ncbi:hypothetical protein DC487_08795 [Sphingobacterium corticibacter]|uniref:Uncharacterized protein n=1 Tax=Sphingobacterium corticibacter TaxID=2171749 RepID=A0A2T8HHW1_9SPHI|nr:hypothetical protein DC487_08795 [Sphingobacterium corticibacter]
MVQCIQLTQILTCGDFANCEINLSQIAYYDISANKGGTRVMYNTGREMTIITVKETPEQIRKKVEPSQLDVWDAILL